MTKEEATKKYYDLVEQCKIEDVNCEKYNKHHIDPLFTLKDEYNAKRTIEFRYKHKDDFELLKCSIPHHVKLHYFLCFMFDRNSDNEKSARHSFWQISGRYIKNENDELTDEQLNELMIQIEKVHKLNLTHEELLERNRNYRHSSKRKERLNYLNSRLCLDPRFDIGGFNYFVGRYVSYGTLYSWAKWEKEQEHNPMFVNITVPKFCKQYLIYDDDGNEMIFDECMNDKYREEYDKKLKERQKKNVRECSKRRRLNENVKNRERENRNKLRHRVCKDPRFNKIERDSSHKPYEEYTTYYVLYDWAKRRLSSENMTDAEKELLNGFNKAEDFAKFYLIKDENGNYIYKEPKGIVAWKENKCNKHDYVTYSKNARHKLCVDPRFGKEIKVTEYTNKIWDKEICSCNALGQWWDKNSNHEIVNGLSKKEFLRKYILIDSEGNYIYDEETALKIIHNNTIFEM